METNPFESLRIQLEQEEYPSLFLFKFISPNDSEKIALITSMFEEGSEIIFHPSKTGKYMSISAKEIMLDADSIIERFEKAAKIPGVISL